MESKLWRPIRKCIDTINHAAMPAVHHYTSRAGAVGILESGRFWFTERTHLNDPTEISYGVDIAQKILSNLGEQVAAEELARRTAIIFDRFAFFSASYSLHRNDINQWKCYGDDHLGVMLSFKATAFSNPKEYADDMIGSDPTAVVCPMSYDTERLVDLLADIIHLWDRNNFDDLVDHILIASGLFKSECWKSENEYRSFIHQNREVITTCPFYKLILSNGKTVSYLDFPIRNWNSQSDFPIYSITVGSHAPVGLELDLRQIIDSKKLPIHPDCIHREKNA